MVTWEYQFYPIKKGTYNNNFSILTTNKLYSTRHYYNILKKLSIFDRKGKQNHIYTYRISVLNLIKKVGKIIFIINKISVFKINSLLVTNVVRDMFRSLGQSQTRSLVLCSDWSRASAISGLDWPMKTADMNAAL